jgi:hypothetical protein
MQDNKNINIQSFKVTKEKFFKMWLTILQPFLKLRNKELELLAKLLYHRYLISLEVKNKEMLDELLFSSKIKKKILSELDIPEHAYNNLLSCLRKKKIVIDKSINKQIIPTITEPFDNFKLVYNIDIVDAK